MSYLRRVVWFGFISRQTIFLFVAAVMFSVPLGVEIRTESRPCAGIVNGMNLRRDVRLDDPPSVGFSPCPVHGPLSPYIDVIAIGWLLSSMGFVLSFLLDVYWGVRRNAGPWGEIVGGWLRRAG